MKKCRNFTAFILIICGLFAACKTTNLPPKEETVVHVIDSVVWHDSTVITYIPKEVDADVVRPLDTLKLETTYAKAEAYLDTTLNVLKGKIENKPDVPVKTEIKWKEKIVYKDSIQTVEKPYPVEKPVPYVPKFYRYAAVFMISIVGFGIFRLIIKFKLGK